METEKQPGFCRALGLVKEVSGCRFLILSAQHGVECTCCHQGNPPGPSSRSHPLGRCTGLCSGSYLSCFLFVTKTMMALDMFVFGHICLVISLLLHIRWCWAGVCSVISIMLCVCSSKYDDTQFWFRLLSFILIHHLDI